MLRALSPVSFAIVDGAPSHCNNNVAELGRASSQEMYRCTFSTTALLPWTSQQLPVKTNSLPIIFSGTSVSKFRSFSPICIGTVSIAASANFLVFQTQWGCRFVLSLQSPNSLLDREF